MQKKSAIYLVDICWTINMISPVLFFTLCRCSTAPQWGANTVFLFRQDRVNEYHRAVTRYAVKALRPFSTVEYLWFRYDTEMSSFPTKQTTEKDSIRDSKGFRFDKMQTSSLTAGEVTHKSIQTASETITHISKKIIQWNETFKF